MARSTLILIVSNLADLTLFFGAAVAMALGILSLH